MPVHVTCEGCALKDRMRDDSERPGAGTSIVLVPQRVGEAMMSEQAEKAAKRSKRMAAAEE